MTTVTACIVQARFASTRLPGKVMLELGGATVLSHVLNRCRRIPGVDVVVCATVDQPDCDPVAAEATAAGAVVIRGSESDVLARYHAAACAVGADTVLRVTSDCPLIDPRVCGDVIALRARGGADYAANNTPPSWPHGLDCEAFTFAALEEATSLATDLFDREHVTPWIRRNPAYSRLDLAGPGGDAVAQRWTLDSPEDYAFFRALFAALDDVGCDTRAVLDLVRRRPDIAAINAHLRPPERRGPADAGTLSV